MLVIQDILNKMHFCEFKGLLSLQTNFSIQIRSLDFALPTFLRRSEQEQVSGEFFLILDFDQVSRHQVLPFAQHPPVIPPEASTVIDQVIIFPSSLNMPYQVFQRLLDHGNDQDQDKRANSSQRVYW